MLLRTRLQQLTRIYRTSMTRHLSSEGSCSSSTFDHENEHAKESLFDLYRNPETDRISANSFLKALEDCGLLKDDVRVARIIERMQNEKVTNDQCCNVELDRAAFFRCLGSKATIVLKAFTGQLIVPDWPSFKKTVGELFEKARPYKDGNLATYIPQLARTDPELWSVSICTVDGQRASWGDHNVPFCLQSVAKPFNYAAALNLLGVDYVHKYVGQEPSGRFFNEICLDADKKPHNPMVNAGAIVVTSLLNPKEGLSDRFDFILKTMRKFAGEQFVSFKNSVFLSERETADRNYAISYYMREHNCFPPNTNLVETLDLYFQSCSISVNTDSLAVMAATLANGGVCPLNNERVVSNRAVRDTLSLMLSCGMYDYSGQFAFKVGLPAKSGVSGDMMIVVPNCMGIAIYSPRLDQFGNTVRGVKFAEHLVESYNLHHYDSLSFAENNKMDPRKNPDTTRWNGSIDLMYAAKNDDIAAIKRHLLGGAGMQATDYDDRTVLHIAASYGRIDAMKFFLQRWKGDLNVKDRNGVTPLEEAEKFGHNECAELLREAIRTRAKPPTNSTDVGDKETNA
uniref:glutaminase n=1 Tax=Panagrellus redivivus TaxID=6233 RepID=A0A7E4UWV5_PANRE